MKNLDKFLEDNGTYTFEKGYIYTFNLGKFMRDLKRLNFKYEDGEWAYTIPDGSLVIQGITVNTEGETFIISPKWCSKWTPEEYFINSVNIPYEGGKMDD